MKCFWYTYIAQLTKTWRQLCDFKMSELELDAESNLFKRGDMWTPALLKVVDNLMRKKKIYL